MKFLEFIKNNKILVFLSITVIGLFIIFMIAVFSSSDTSEKTLPIVPTPTLIQQIRPTPTINPDIQEKVPTDIAPWIFQLPLKNEFYFVDYNPATKIITARIYPVFSFSIPKEDQIPNLKNRVEEHLKEIGVDIQKESIEWIIED